MSALGQKQTYSLQQAMSRFTPNSDRDSGHAANGMSAVAPKADMCSAQAHVCFGPKADIWPLFDHFIRASLQCRRYAEAEGLRGLQIDYQLETRRHLDR